ncbi:MAG: bis(5'-nucleosyl)-tetraphosphatase (symmetrical) YqeK [Clostridium sp.]
MYNEALMDKYIKSHLKNKRYVHTLGVVEMSEKLADIYNYDKHKARIAALMHDCAKNMSEEELLRITKENNLVEIDNIIEKSPMLLHGIVGAYIAKKEFKITDEDIINAIKYHTTGRENMSILEKIIYIADCIEMSRDFEGVDELRKIAYENLDHALLMIYDQTIKYIISNGWLLYPKTIEARNYLLIR